MEQGKITDTQKLVINWSVIVGGIVLVFLLLGKQIKKLLGLGGDEDLTDARNKAAKAMEQNPDSFKGRNGRIMSWEDIVSDAQVIANGWGYIYNNTEEINQTLHKQSKISFLQLQNAYNSLPVGRLKRNTGDLIADIKNFGGTDMVKWWGWLWS